jgi:tetratricopeptide (TPR) repeat protein
MNIFKKNLLIVVLSMIPFSNLKSEIVKEHLTIDDNSPDSLATEFFIKGNDASARGDYKTSLKFFREMSSIQPDNNYFRSKLAIELIRCDELVEAEKILEPLVNESHYQDESTRIILAGLYVALEKKDKARTLYKAILNKGIDIEEACIFLAKSFSIDKKYSDAHKLLAKCESKNKSEPIYAFYRGKIEYERGNHKESEIYLKKALKINHAFSNAALSLGGIYEQKNDLKTAVKIYTDFLATEGNSRNISVLSHLVTLLFSMEENLAVIPYAETLNSISDADMNLKIRLGFLYSDAGRYNEAISTFKEALVMAPDSEKISYYLGVVSQQAKQFDEAIKYYGRIPVSSALYKNAEKKVKQMTNNLSQDNVPKNLWSSLLKELNTQTK